jgi:superfamily II DNA or RNA helicase
MNHSTSTTELLTLNNWSEIKNKLDCYKLFTTPQAIGKDFFETFAKLYFTCEPSLKDEYSEVLFHKDINAELKKELNFRDVEHGVDLLLIKKNGKRVAVQCKYSENQDKILSWSGDKLSNLYSYGHKCDEYFVFSNTSGLTDINNDRVDKHFKIDDLLDISSDTLTSMLELFSKKKTVDYKKKTPRKDSQDIAIFKAIEHYQNNTRGQLIVPCGFGKTLTALWIKEALESKLTLFLVPSLSLLRQTKKAWLTEKNTTFEYMCICSESDINNDDSTDENIEHTWDIGDVSTDKASILLFLNTEKEKVIFSTYQSIDKLIASVNNTNIVFDLIICDEAHRTTGVKNEAEYNNFKMVHDDGNIKATKRLYMTATPKAISKNLKTRLESKKQNFEYFGMNDHDIYGTEFYSMSFKNAIEKGILTDYKIITVGITDTEIRNIIDEAGENEVENIAHNIALDKTMRALKVNHALTFHSSIKNSKGFTDRHNKYFKEDNIYVNFVSGEQPTSDRALTIEKFKESQKGILSNARCLTEGVDVPAIEVVYFCDKKNSEIDIIQASGRALRLNNKKEDKIGYIVVPIYHLPNEDIEERAKDKCFDNLIHVIRAMSSQDERLLIEINEIINNPKAQGNHIFDLNDISDSTENNLIYFSNITEELKEVIFTKELINVYDYWEKKYFKLKNTLEINGFDYDTLDEDIKTWVINQKTLYKSNKIYSDRINLLESLQGWVWESISSIEYKISAFLNKNNITDDKVDFKVIEDLILESSIYLDLEKELFKYYLGGDLKIFIQNDIRKVVTGFDINDNTVRGTARRLKKEKEVQLIELIKKVSVQKQTELKSIINDKQIINIIDLNKNFNCDYSTLGWKYIIETLTGINLYQSFKFKNLYIKNHISDRNFQTLTSEIDKINKLIESNHSFQKKQTIIKLNEHNDNETDFAESIIKEEINSDFVLEREKQNKIIIFGESQSKADRILQFFKDKPEKWFTNETLFLLYNEKYPNEPLNKFRDITSDIIPTLEKKNLLLKSGGNTRSGVAYKLNPTPDIKPEHNISSPRINEIIEILSENKELNLNDLLFKLKQKSTTFKTTTELSGVITNQGKGIIKRTGIRRLYLYSLEEE